MKKQIMSIAIICFMAVEINVCSIFQIKAEMMNSDERDTEVTEESVEQQGESESDVEENTDIWQYYVNKVTNTIEIRGYSGEKTNITIPESIEGKTVTAISGRAFRTNNITIRSITIPKSVIRIEKNALWGCGDRLFVIRVSPDNPVYASENGILYDKEKTKLICCPRGKKSEIASLPESLKSIGDFAFFDCKYLKSIEIPEGVRYIGISAFQSCEKLENIVLPKDLEIIEDTAFYGCAMFYFKLPSNLRKIGDSVFGDCLNIKSFCVSPDNPAFETENGILYDKGKNKLIAYPAGKQEQVVELPEGLTCIGAGAFRGCFSITDIHFSESIKEIKKNAFDHCSGLMNIYVPKKNGFYSSKDGILYNKEMTYLMTCPNGKQGEISTLPKSLIGIGEKAFQECDQITSIFLPSGVECIERQAFWGCNNLENIDITAENQFFTTEGGVLYNKEKTEIIVYPSKRQDTVFTLPEGVRGIREFAFYMCTNLQRIDFPESLRSIGDNAFYGCSGLRSAVLPDKLECIGDFAFHDCPLSSERLILPDGLKVIGQEPFSIRDLYFEEPQNPVYIDGDYDVHFVTKEGLEYIFLADGTVEISDCLMNEAGNSAFSLVIPEKIGGNVVTSIGYEAFCDCTHLVHIKLPDTLVRIKESAFIYCWNLIELELPEGVEEIEKNAFLQCERLQSVKFPDSLKEIGDGAFAYCEALVQIELPKDLKSLGENAFEQCKNLERVKLPTSLEYIEDGTFSYCEKLKNITFSESLKSIGAHAFEFCISLTELKIPRGVEHIGEKAFEYCCGLKKVELPESLKELETHVFFGCRTLENICISTESSFYASENGILFNKEKTELLCCPEGKQGNISGLPKNLRSIGDDAFSGCENLTGIELPEGVLNIGDFAFGYCKNISEIKLPENLKNLGYSAFAVCENLKSIELPDSLKIIRKETFAGCIGLEEIYLPDNIKIIEEGAFLDCVGLTSLILPENLEYYNKGAVDGCDMLTDLYYPKSEDDWNKVAKASPYIGSYPLNIEEWFDQKTEQDTYPSDEITQSGRNYFTEKDWLYSINRDGVTVTIQGYLGNERNVIIPDIIAGRKVTDIARVKQLNLVSVEISDNVSSIEDRAFFGCSQLEEVKLPQGLIYIGDSAFAFCGKLTEIDLPETLSILGERAFEYCRNLSHVELPLRVRVIEEGAFWGCESLVEMDFADETGFSEGLGFVEKDAFRDCTSLKTVKLPEYLRYVGKRAFKGCCSLKDIYYPSYGNWDEYCFMEGDNEEFQTTQSHYWKKEEEEY